MFVLHTHKAGKSDGLPQSLPSSFLYPRAMSAAYQQPHTLNLLTLVATIGQRDQRCNRVYQNCMSLQTVNSALQVIMTVTMISSRALIAKTLHVTVAKKTQSPMVRTTQVVHYSWK